MPAHQPVTDHGWRQHILHTDTTSIAVGPTIGKNIALAYLPYAYAQVGRELQIRYFADVYPVRVEAVGYKSLYDPENVKPRS